MKYLVIGLGNFGKTFAETLTDKGEDVFGVDINEHRVDAVKERISVAYILDATEPSALQALPLKEFDAVIVAIGQHMDASLRTVAVLKELSVEHIYARSIDQIHKSILHAMNIQSVFEPEHYAARLFAEKMGHDTPIDLL